MKFIYLLLILALNLTANTAQELYRQAGEFEKNGDIRSAMEYYKLAAKTAIDEDNTQIPDEVAIAPNPIVTQILVQADERNATQTSEKKASKKNLGESYESAQPYNLDEILGIKMHHLNYLLPATTTFKNIEGRKKFETNFQISLQKPIFYDLLDLNETISVGYSQESWWQTAKSSTPFRETNYRPEIFITFPTDFKFLPSMDYLRFGLLHESNGQGGVNSRSWNRFYASSKFNIGRVILFPRAWLRIPDPDGDDNPDIEKYIGRADLTLAYPFRGHFFTAMIRNNLRFDKTNKGAAELGWMFPFGKTGIYGYVKYFSGYGESLIDYDRYMNKLGIGFALIK